MSNQTIAFIGAGNMASALIGGLISDGTPPARLLASDPDPEKCGTLSQATGIRTTTDNREAVATADVVVLAVKPQVLRDVAISIRSMLQQRQPLVISIAAGIRCDALQRWLGDSVSVVRTMPNTPAMVASGATALYAGTSVSDAQRQTAESIMRAVGLTRWVATEAEIDAVTAVSGSGPAYFFLVMEAMETAARKLGLEPDTAHLLTLQTALGAARMALESDDDPAMLRRKVTSPGGTTEQAIAVFEQADMRGLFEKAMRAAHDRSITLSEELGND